MFIKLTSSINGENIFVNFNTIKIIVPYQKFTEIIFDQSIHPIYVKESIRDIFLICEETDERKKECGKIDRQDVN